MFIIIFTVITWPLIGGKTGTFFIPFPSGVGIAFIINGTGHHGIYMGSILSRKTAYENVGVIIITGNKAVGGVRRAVGTVTFRESR